MDVSAVGAGVSPGSTLNEATGGTVTVNFPEAKGELVKIKAKYLIQVGLFLFTVLFALMCGMSVSVARINSHMASMKEAHAAEIKLLLNDIESLEEMFIWHNTYTRSEIDNSREATDKRLENLLIREEQYRNYCNTRMNILEEKMNR